MERGDGGREERKRDRGERRRGKKRRQEIKRNKKRERERDYVKLILNIKNKITRSN